MHGKTTVLAATLILLLASSATADWKGWDSIPEPNTHYDLDGPMWEDAPGSSASPRAYLDGFLVQDVGFGAAHVTANVDGTRFMPPAAFRPMALVGFWVDCNGDGFIGNSVTGQMVYDASFADPSRCPAGTAYNDGTQVDEWRALHRGVEPHTQGGATLAADPYDVLDTGARAWGDWGYPDEPATIEYEPMPLPPGTLTTYHGHFRYVDGMTLGDLSRTAWKLGLDYYAIPTMLSHHADVHDDEGDREGDSPLAYVRYAWNTSTSRYGGERDCGAAGQPDCKGAYAQPAVAAWDCTRPALADEETGDLDGDGHAERVVIPQPAPDADPFGSVDGALYQLTRAPLVQDPDAEACEDEGKHLPYANLEASNHASAAVYIGKHAADFILHPVPERRLMVYGTAENVADPAGGTCHLGPTCTFAGGYWTTDEVFLRIWNRLDWGLTEPGKITYYADVTDEALVNAGTDESALPDGNDNHRYGEDQCDGFGPGEASFTGTWACDPGDWPQDEPRVGDPYDLRDVDCYDGDVPYAPGPLLTSC